MSLSAEEVLLLKLASPPRPDSEEESSVRSIPAGAAIDEHSLYGKIRQNGVSGFCYRNSVGNSLLSEEFKQRLQSDYRQISIQNLDKASENIRIIRLLSANGIEVIPLKGAVAAETVFADLGIYPSGDIDILIRVSDLMPAKKVLMEQGDYMPTEHHSEQDQLESSYHLIFQRSHYSLEVHWNLTMRYFRTPPEYWWNDTRSTCWQGLEILELSPENYILYTVFRVFCHANYPLRFWVLIAGIINRHGQEINWRELLSTAARFKMRRVLIFTLKMTNEFFGTEIPDVILGQRILGYSLLKRLVLSGFFGGIRKKHLRMLLYTTLLDNPVEFCRVLLERLIPSRSELRLRYQIKPGSPKILFYYVLNPFILLMKKYNW